MLSLLVGNHSLRYILVFLFIRYLYVWLKAIQNVTKKKSVLNTSLIIMKKKTRRYLLNTIVKHQRI